MNAEETRKAPRGVRRPAATCCMPALPGARPEAVAAQGALFAALCDPTRLRIVEMLAKLDEPLCVCEITGHFALGQPTISHHLRVLREARLVTWEKRGLWVYYALDRAVLGRGAEYLGGLAGQPESGLERRTA